MKKILTFSILIGFLLILGLLLTDCKKIEISGDPVQTESYTKKPTIKVYLENSGSMDGYMCDGSQLKDAVYDYISEIDRLSDTTSLYFINSKIIPYSGKLQSYIKDMTPANFHSAGGNTSNTDIGDLFDMVLSTVNDTTVSIFISDCILDLPAKNAVDFLNNCEITIKQHIIETQKRVPNLGVEIFQLTSKFSGKYFSPNGMVKQLNDVQRPYYIWIFGAKKYIAKFNQDAPYSQLDKYNLKGVVSFSNQSPSEYEVGNRNFTSNLIVPSHGDYLAAFKVDLSSTLQPEDVIMDKSNYSFVNKSLEIEDIYSIDKKTDNSNFTHIINIKIPKGTNIAQDRLTLDTPSNLPSWVSRSNDETGDNINANLDKTTGIQYLIQGVADAYKNEKILTTFKFNVKRK